MPAASATSTMPTTSTAATASVSTAATMIQRMAESKDWRLERPFGYPDETFSKEPPASGCQRQERRNWIFHYLHWLCPDFTITTMREHVFQAVRRVCNFAHVEGIAITQAQLDYKVDLFIWVSFFNTWRGVSAPCWPFKNHNPKGTVEEEGEALALTLWRSQAQQAVGLQDQLDELRARVLALETRLAREEPSVHNAGGKKRKRSRLG